MKENSSANLKGSTTVRLVLVTLALALLATACSKAANTNSTNSSTTTNSTSTTANTTSTTSSGTASDGSLATSPIAAYKAFQDANRKKDYEAVKRRFSKGSLTAITEEAKSRNQTLDEFIKQQVDNGKTEEEVSNEKITGDTATIELKDKSSSRTLTLPMVKEEGEWKIAYDKFLEQMKSEIEKMQRGGSQPGGSDNGGNDNDNR